MPIQHLVISKMHLLVLEDTVLPLDSSKPHLGHVIGLVAQVEVVQVEVQYQATIVWESHLFKLSLSQETLALPIQMDLVHQVGLSETLAIQT